VLKRLTGAGERKNKPSFPHSTARIIPPCGKVYGIN
jgi:hypothetical protein